MRLCWTGCFSSAGLLYSSLDGLEIIHPKGFIHISQKTGSQWSSSIQNFCKTVIANCLQNLSEEMNNFFDEIKETNKVFLDTMTSYLSQNFKLNNEQERVFYMVANHATINNPT